MATKNGATNGAPHFRKHGRIATIRLDGIVERSAIEIVDSLLRKEGENIAGAILDLSLASHVDYRVAPILVARRRVLHARGGEFAVVAARTDVRLILRAAAGAEIPVFQTKEEATAYVRGEPGPVVAAVAKAGKRVERVR